MIETIVENSYSALDGRAKVCGRLSDNTLAVVVQKANGSNWDHKVFKSINGGATWSEELTIVSNTKAQGFGRWIGDKLYYVFADYDTANQPVTFYRVGYNSGTQAFSLEINGATVRAAVSGRYFGLPAIDKEPGGRLWCAYADYVSSNNISMAYSDNDGSSWTVTTFSEACGTFGYNSGSVDHPINICCLEKSTNLVFGDYRTSGAMTGAKFRKRLHTDDVNTWASVASIKDVSTNVPAPFCKAVREPDSPCKRIWGVVVDRVLNPKRAFWFRGVEDSSGDMVWTVGTYFEGATGETIRIVPTARTDGAQYLYIQGGSLGTMRRRNVAEGASGGGAFGSESTWSLSNSVVSIERFRPIENYDGTLDSHHFVLTGTGSAGNYRPYVLRENLPSGPGAANIFRTFPMPVEILGSVQRTYTYPVEVLGARARAFTLPVEFNPFIAISRAFPIPVEILQGQDHKLPIPVEWTGDKVLERKLPIPVEWKVGLERKLPLEVEWLAGSLSRKFVLEVEILGGVRRISWIEVEWRGDNVLTRKIPMPVATLLALSRKLPIPVEWAGQAFGITHTRIVLRPQRFPLTHERTIIPDAQSFPLTHSRTIRQTTGATLRHSRVILPAELIPLFNEDIHLPTGEVDKT